MANNTEQSSTRNVVTFAKQGIFYSAEVTGYKVKNTSIPTITSFFNSVGFGEWKIYGSTSALETTTISGTSSSHFNTVLSNETKLSDGKFYSYRLIVAEDNSEAYIIGFAQSV